MVLYTITFVATELIYQEIIMFMKIENQTIILIQLFLKNLLNKIRDLITFITNGEIDRVHLSQRPN